MRLGMCGAFLPDDMDDMSPDICKRVRDMGFSGIFTRFRKNDPHSTSKSSAERLRKLLEDENLLLFQVTGYWQNLITADESVRRESVRTVQAALQLAGWLGARCGWPGAGAEPPSRLWTGGEWVQHTMHWTSSGVCLPHILN